MAMEERRKTTTTGRKKGGLKTMPFIFGKRGMALLTVSAVLPQFRPPPCKPGGAVTCQEAAPWQLAVLYVSLLLNAFGAGGYRPCIVAFGADQFDESRAAERARSWGFFNWYYFCNGASMLLAVTAVVYVQDNVGWGWGLGVPAFCMGVSVAAFVAGYPMYRRLDMAGSPFTRLAQVVVAAAKKRRLPAGDVDPGSLYENDELDAPISMYGKLVHTDQLSFFDRAAVVTDGDLVAPTDDAASGKPSAAPVPNPWRLSTVHRVEELKSVIRMGPIWAAGILVITASSTQHTFSLQQATTMDRRLAPGLSAFQIPAGSMTVFALLAMLLTLFVYDRALVPLARRFTGLDRGISFLHRMGVGFAVCVLATLVAGFVERHRRHAAAAAGATDAGTSPLSAYWLVPQYALHGVAEAFTSVGHLEFMYDQAPESMRSTATALFWLSISLGSYASTALVDAVHRWSAGPGGANWLPDNINHGRLDYFYWVVTALQFMNLVYYAVCAKRFTFKPVQLHKEVGEEEGGKALVELQEKV
ncbi:Protein NRT1/ PTR FAMILY 3.1 [Dichanthelium oligosanthes]|uniref:Protein NRT1/ PTR FAMILY 3.1 n=1 Tax=Dichanthelium oligosanthes TaxID=888268 RepID=A0A1E5VL02_9POAL|nr:Protein NRT1/ PTR FAMILY 3.1 [Dichanthelium oligosanthes]